MNTEEFINESVEAFRNQLTEALSVANEPENIRWAVFSVGNKELEDQVLDHLVSAFLNTVEGVYIFRPEDPEHCRSWLKEALATLEKEYFVEKSAATHDYVLKTGD